MPGSPAFVKMWFACQRSDVLKIKCLFAIVFPALFDMGEELKAEVHCNLIKVARLLPTLAGHLEGQKGNWDTGGDVQGLYTPASIV